MSAPSKSAVPNLQRGMAILEFLATSQSSCSISELSEQLGYPSASVFRITRELMELGYLSRDAGTKRYSLTNKFLLLGQPQGRSRSLVEASLGAMRRLNRDTKETTQLCCLVELDSVILDQLISTHPFKYSGEVGARCPAYSCAPGKAIIANLPEENREELIERLPFKRFTPHTICDPDAFREELSSIEKCGYALDRSEGMLGIHCVAAAIRDRNGYPVGAITIAGPAARLPESEFESLGKLVRTVTAHAEANYRQ